MPPHSSSSRPGTRRVLSAPDARASRQAANQATLPRWLLGAVAGVQAAVFTYLCVVVPTVAAYLSTSASSSRDSVTWMDAARTGTDLWLWMHGAALTVHVGQTATATISAVPLGLALVAVWACQFTIRVSHQSSVTALATCAAGYAVVVAVLGGAVGTVAARGGLVRAVALGAILAGVGAWWGARRLPGWRTPAAVTTWVGQLPAWAGVGVRAGIMATLGTVALGAVACGGWAVVGASRMEALFSGLRPDALGSIVLIIGQLAVIPNLAIWGASYLLGPGFHVGTGTLFSPGAVSTAPMPALPVFGALPDAQPQSWYAVFMVVPVVAFLAVGWWVARRVRRESWGECVGACVTAAVAGAGTLWIVGYLASGAAGPGRLTEVGPRLTATTAVMLLEVLVASAAVVGLEKSGAIAWLGARLPGAKRRAGRRRQQGAQPAAVDAHTRAAERWHLAPPPAREDDTPGPQ